MRPRVSGPRYTIPQWRSVPPATMTGARRGAWPHVDGEGCTAYGQEGKGDAVSSGSARQADGASEEDGQPA